MKKSILKFIVSINLSCIALFIVTLLSEDKATIEFSKALMNILMSIGFGYLSLREFRKI